MTKAGAAVVLAALILGAPPPTRTARGADRGPELERYVDLVGRYASGDRLAAVAALGSWRDQDVETAIDLLNAWRRNEASGPSGVDSTVFDAFPLASAVLLHAERARAESQPAKEDFHFDLARRLAQLLWEFPRHREFVRRFYLAATLRAYREMQWSATLDLAAKGLKLIPGDPELLLTVASLEEAAGSLALLAGEEQPTQFATGSLTGRDLWERTERERHLAEAEDALARALAADPAFPEAHLRMGRVLWRRGKPEAGRLQLERLLAGSKDGRIRYLAHLFLGRIHEDAGRLDDATREYRAALDVAPLAQTPQVALAHLLQGTGDESGCRAAVLLATQPSRGSEGDDFWEYPWGWSGQADQRFEALVAEAAR